MTLKEVSCECTVTDLCPQGRMGHAKHCRIMIDEDKMLQDNELVRRERDRLWCAAICNILDVSIVNTILTEFNKLRGNGL